MTKSPYKKLRDRLKRAKNAEAFEKIEANASFASKAPRTDRKWPRKKGGP